MSTRALRRAAYAPLLALVVLLALGTGTAVRAADATLDDYGWWTEANPVSGVTTPGTDQTPDVKDMHVAIGPIAYDDPNSLVNDNKTGAVEVSAVRFKLPEAVSFDTDPATPVANINLPVDPAYKPTGEVVVMACRPLLYWHGELDGNWNDRVYYQSGCSVGVTNDNGASYDFTVLASQLSGGRQYVDMAIAPTQDPTASPFAMWFLPPKAADITLMALPLSATDFAPPPPPAPAAALSGSGYPTAAFAPTSAPPAPAPVQPPAVAPQRPAAPPQLAVAAARPAAVDTAARAVAGVLLLAVILAMMSAAGMDMQRLLTPAGQLGGVGRFRRQRTGTPLPL